MLDFEDITPLIKNIIIIDAEGKRIAVKYYSDEWPTVTAQANYEKDLFKKISRGNQRGSDGDIMLFNELSVVFKRVGDLNIIITGSQEENEVLLYTVLSGLAEALNLLLRGVVEKKTVLENLDLVLIAIDEVVDSGVILEVDAATIAQRVVMRTDGGSSDLSIAEQA